MCILAKGVNRVPMFGVSADGGESKENVCSDDWERLENVVTICNVIKVLSEEKRLLRDPGTELIRLNYVKKVSSLVLETNEKAETWSVVKKLKKNNVKVIPIVRKRTGTLSTVQWELIGELSERQLRGLNPGNVYLLNLPVIKFLDKIGATFVTCKMSTTISEAIDLLAASRSHWLWIVDKIEDDNKHPRTSKLILIGVLSIHDLLTGLITTGHLHWSDSKSTQTN